MWRIWLGIGVIFALAACGPRQAAPRPLSSTPAADGGPSEVEAATLTAVSIQVLATPTRPPATATPRVAAMEILLDWECERTSIGQVKFTGKVRNNTTDQSFSAVRVRASVVAAGVTNDDYTFVDSGALRPGQVSTFTAYVRDPDPQGRVIAGGSCKVQIESYR